MADVRGPCDRLSDALAEVALGVLDPAEVPGLDEHLATCPACRAELVELAASADRLVLVAPLATVPDGLEQRIVAAVGGRGSDGAVARPRRRRRAVASIVALVAAASVAIGIGIVLRDDPDGSRDVVATELRTPDGRAVGRITFDEAPATMTVSLDGVDTGQRYRCELVLADGTRREVGAWTVSGSGDMWSVSVPDEPASRVELSRVSDGVVVASATLAG